MDMAPATTNLTTITTATATATGGFLPVKSPEAGSETPSRIQPDKPISFSNGVLKRRKAPMSVISGGGVVYKECLKNHAASLGGHALDGCGEFMPALSATVVDPMSLKCAACGCHRNFHRREMEEMAAGGTTTQLIEYHPPHRHHPLPPPGTHHHSAPSQPLAARRVQSPGSDNNSPPPISSSYYPGSAPHMLLALSSGGAGVDMEEYNNNINKTVVQYPNNNNHGHLLNQSPNLPSRKRFRTKFSQEQKEKMQDFAEKVGWRLLKSNEEMVNGFCNEIGVERGVFKVWMHNNKNSLAKRSATSTTLPPANYGISATTNQAANEISNAGEDGDEDEHGAGNGVVGNSNSNSHSSSININIHDHHHHQLKQQYNDGSTHESNAPTNGSSSSS